jgi:DNA-binding MarR family transcriptional regulator
MKASYEGKLHTYGAQRASQRRLSDDVGVRTPDDLSTATQDVAAQLRIAAVALVRRLRSTASPGNLTWSQEAALLRLETAGPQTVSQLARAEGTRSQSTGAIVAALEAQGLVNRAADTGDGRQSIISVSDEGRCALNAARAIKQDWLADRLVDQLSEPEREIVAKAVPILQRIADCPAE